MKKAVPAMPLEELMHAYPWNFAYEVISWPAVYHADDVLKQIDADRLLAARIYVPGFLAEIDELSFQEQSVVHMRYEDGMTYSKIGMVMRLTRERIRQIEEGVVRRLKNPARMRHYILMHPDRAEGLVKDNERLRLENILLREKLIKACGELGIKKEDVFLYGYEPAEAEEPTIEEMELSVRSYNCLRRGGIFTIKQLQGVSQKDLLGIKNLGKACVNEIVSKAKAFGIVIKEE